MSLDAPLALLTLAGNTYSGAVYRWRSQTMQGGGGREPLAGDRADLEILQDDQTMALLIDIAASENHPAHRAVLSAIAPDVGTLMSSENMLGDMPAPT